VVIMYYGDYMWTVKGVPNSCSVHHCVRTQKHRKVGNTAILGMCVRLSCVSVVCCGLV
jgi:hypothetical protein